MPFHPGAFAFGLRQTGCRQVCVVVVAIDTEAEAVVAAAVVVQKIGSEIGQQAVVGVVTPLGDCLKVGENHIKLN